MNVDDVVAEKIAAAARKATAAKEQRAEFAAARRAGIARRHATKLRRLAQPLYNNTTPAASGC
ncbi:hypothetical protein [Streptomyces fagopyri]